MDAKKTYEDNGFFGAKQGINSAALHSNRDGAIGFAQGLVRGSIQELVSLMGEREAFEWVMKQAEGIIREPSTTAGGLWTPGKKD